MKLLLIRTLATLILFIFFGLFIVSDTENWKKQQAITWDTLNIWLEDGRQMEMYYRSDLNFKAYLIVSSEPDTTNQITILY